MLLHVAGHKISLQDKVTQRVIMNALICDVEACMYFSIAYVLISS